MKRNKTPVKEKHKSIDLEYKKLAREYEKSVSLIESRIKKIEKIVAALPAKAPDKDRLGEDLRILRQMCRTTREIGRETGCYYEGGWWRSAIYTLNSR